jgi:hypothetical protein
MASLVRRSKAVASNTTIAPLAHTQGGHRRLRYHDATSTSPSPTGQPPSFVPATGATTRRRGHVAVAEEDTPPAPATLHHTGCGRQTVAAEVPRHRNWGRRPGRGRTEGAHPSRSQGDGIAADLRRPARKPRSSPTPGRTHRSPLAPPGPRGQSGGLARGSDKAQGGSSHRTRERHRRAHHEETPGGEGEVRRGRGGGALSLPSLRPRGQPINLQF